MGNQNQNTEREGPKKNKKCKENKKMLQFLTCATILSLSVGAPQYGGVQPSLPVKTAPPDRVCTVQDRVHHPVGHRVQGDRDRGVHHSMRRCAGLRHRDCASQPPDRSAAQSMRSSATPCTRTCAWSSTRQSTSHTQRLSV